MFFPVGQQTYPTLVHVPWVEYTTVSGVVRKQVWSKSISWRWRLSILPAFLQQMTCLYSLTRIIFPSILRRDGNSTGSKPHAHCNSMHGWQQHLWINSMTHISVSLQKQVRDVYPPPANWAWWCLMGIQYPPRNSNMEFKIALKKQWSSKGCISSHHKPR